MMDLYQCNTMLAIYSVVVKCNATCASPNIILYGSLSAITCPQVPNVTHASPNTTLAIYSTVVEYVCEFGYLFPDRNVTAGIICLDTGPVRSGQWNVSHPGHCEGMINAGKDLGSVGIWVPGFGFKEIWIWVQGFRFRGIRVHGYGLRGLGGWV